MTTSTALDGITWEEPPTPSPALSHGPSPVQLRAALQSRPGQWAVVARPDRASRAATVQERWTAEGYESVVVKVGPEHRVYARVTAAAADALKTTDIGNSVTVEVGDRANYGVAAPAGDGTWAWSIASGQSGRAAFREGAVAAAAVAIRKHSR